MSYQNQACRPYSQLPTKVLGQVCYATTDLRHTCAVYLRQGRLLARPKLHGHSCYGKTSRLGICFSNPDTDVPRGSDCGIPRKWELADFHPSPNACKLVIREVDLQEWMLVADLQAAAFYDPAPLAFLDSVAFNSFRAEIRSSLSSKLRYNDPSRYFNLILNFMCILGFHPAYCQHWSVSRSRTYLVCDCSGWNLSVFCFGCLSLSLENPCQMQKRRKGGQS
mmetsp:Transcript_20175/g.48050  ORF Transcript_20175/g.48050 Transcript_20175/m.48050 type:complete len:222 (-) Transcript_20175:775-1440(-)